MAALLVHRVVVHHGVHVARRHEETQARLAEHGDALGVAPIGLGDEAHLVAVGLQHARDDGGAEGGVIHVGVARDIDEIELVPAAFVGLGPRGGQEGRGGHRAARWPGTGLLVLRRYRALRWGFLRHSYLLHRKGRGSSPPWQILWHRVAREGAPASSRRSSRLRPASRPPLRPPLRAQARRRGSRRQQGRPREPRGPRPR